MTTQNKQHYISKYVYDIFQPLSDEDKWNGLKGEYTSSPGHQKWTRIKTNFDMTKTYVLKTST